MKITVTRGTIKDGYLRFEHGESYDVKPALGQFFVSQGWADNAAKDVELSEPKDIRELDEDTVMELRQSDKEFATQIQDQGQVDLDIHDVETEGETSF